MIYKGNGGFFMAKKFMKLLVFLVAALAAVAGLLWLDKSGQQDYIEIYSDDEDALF